MHGKLGLGPVDIFALVDVILENDNDDKIIVDDFL